MSATSARAPPEDQLGGVELALGRDRVRVAVGEEPTATADHPAEVAEWRGERLARRRPVRPVIDREGDPVQSGERRVGAPVPVELLRRKQGVAGGEQAAASSTGRVGPRDMLGFVRTCCEAYAAAANADRQRDVKRMCGGRPVIRASDCRQMPPDSGTSTPPSSIIVYWSPSSAQTVGRMSPHWFDGGLYRGLVQRAPTITLLGWKRADVPRREVRPCGAATNRVATDTAITVIAFIATR